MQLEGFGSFLRDGDKTSLEAIKLLTATAGLRANTKGDFRSMSNENAKLILAVRYKVPESILDKLDRRKIMTLLQKKSREALSEGATSTSALSYARITGPRKGFARKQYMKCISKRMKAVLVMLRGAKRTRGQGGGHGAPARAGGHGAGGGGGGG